jgi:hypothetical protein
LAQRPTVHISIWGTGAALVSLPPSPGFPHLFLCNCVQRAQTTTDGTLLLACRCALALHVLSFAGWEASKLDVCGANQAGDL